MYATKHELTFLPQLCTSYT